MTNISCMEEEGTCPRPPVHELLDGNFLPFLDDPVACIKKNFIYVLVRCPTRPYRSAENRCSKFADVASERDSVLPSDNTGVVLIQPWGVSHQANNKRNSHSLELGGGAGPKISTSSSLSNTVIGMGLGGCSSTSFLMPSSTSFFGCLSDGSGFSGSLFFFSSCSSSSESLSLSLSPKIASKIDFGGRSRSSSFGSFGLSLSK